MTGQRDRTMRRPSPGRAGPSNPARQAVPADVRDYPVSPRHAPAELAETPPDSYGAETESLAGGTGREVSLVELARRILVVHRDWSEFGLLCPGCYERSPCREHKAARVFLALVRADPENQVNGRPQPAPSEHTIGVPSSRGDELWSSQH